MKSTRKLLLFVILWSWIWAPSDAQRIPERDLQRIIELARLSEAAYGRDPFSPFGDRSQGLWHHRARDATATGLNWILAERRTPTGSVEWVLSFAGTEFKNDQGRTDIKDVVTDLKQLGGNSMQYDEALQVAQRFVNLARDRGIKLTVTGHSLGGGMSQHVSQALGVPAVVFNSAPLGLRYRQAASPEAAERARTNILNIRLERDPVSISPGCQLGQRHTIDMAPDVKRALPLPVSVQAFGRYLGDVHSQQNLIRSLEYSRTVQGNVALSPTESRIRITRTQAEHVVSTGLSLGKALINLALSSKPSDLPVDKRLELVERGFNYYKLASAWDSDMRCAARGEFVLARAHLLHEGVGQLAGLVEIRLPGRLGKLAGLDDVARGAARHLATGQLDWQTAAYYLDGANKAAWTALGYVASGGNARVATAVGEIASLTVNRVREASQNWFTGLYAARNGHTQIILDNWHRDQRLRAGSNAKIQSFSEYAAANNFSPSALGLSKQAIADLDHNQTQTYRALQRTAGFRTSDSPSQTAAAPREVPSYWVSHNRERRDHATKQDLRFVARMGQSVTRAVVVGDGPEADRVYQRMTARLGSQNVRRVYCSSGHTALQHLARTFGAGGIYGTRPVVTRITHRSSHREVRRNGYRLPSTVTPERPVSPPAPRSSNRSRSVSEAASTTRDWVTSGSVFRHRTGPGVGGVMLDATAGIAESDAMLASGRFSLIFENGNAGLDVRELRRFVTALWAVYFSKEGPGISIDPIAPGVDKHVVRYIGEVINTDLGRVMREADYLMKKWAIGTERPELPGFRNPEDIAHCIGRLCAGGTSRFWFMPTDMRFKLAGRSLLFESGRILLQTESLGSSRRRSEANEQFAREFTAAYPAIAARYPIYQELFEYAKLISLGRFLEEKKVPMLWFLLSNKDLILTEDSPGTVAELVKESVHFENITIKGGVDLKAPTSSVRYVQDANMRQAIADAMRCRSARASRGRPSLTPARVVTVEAKGRRLSMTRSENLTLSSTCVGGDVYQTDIAFRNGRRPGLELVRYYDPDHVGPVTFGRDWHLLVPYRVCSHDARYRPFRGARIPERMRVKNLLTGDEEVLDFNDTKYTAAGYVPVALKESTVIGLFLMSNGSFRLVDKLGSQFHFDSTGELVSMILTDDYTIRLRRSTKTHEVSWRERSAMRLVPGEADMADVGTVRLPRVLDLWEVDRRSTVAFELESNDARGYIRYRPLAKRSPYDRISVMTDGSFVLHEKKGRFFRFNPAGRLKEVGTRVIEEMRCGVQRVRFHYERSGFNFRIARADILSQGATEPTHSVQYGYRDGRLVEVIPSNDKARRIDYGRDHVALVAVAN